MHRDIAPVLAGAVRSWLPAVTNARYVDASVNPASLEVMVKEAATGQWRAARHLSQGTREQIYLLLRAAMAQHLATTGETALLLLDEVTAQSDSTRTAEMLAVLHAMSASRQILLFTHDDAAIAWAQANLMAPADSFVPLPEP